jgi:hypothetical protein
MVVLPEQEELAELGRARELLVARVQVVAAAGNSETEVVLR